MEEKCRRGFLARAATFGFALGGLLGLCAGLFVNPFVTGESQFVRGACGLIGGVIGAAVIYRLYGRDRKA
jgi:hypothetical protein